MNWKDPEQINLDNGETRTLVEGIGVVHGKITQVWTAPDAVKEIDAPKPNFVVCGSCGADAAEFVVWDPGDGWTCLKCHGSDSGD